MTDSFFGSLGIGLVQITVGGIPQPINPVIPSGPTLYPAAGTNGTGRTVYVTEVEHRRVVTFRADQHPHAGERPRFPA